MLTRLVTEYIEVIKGKEYAKSSNQRSGSQAEKFVNFQVREAERLLLRLDLYASDNAVPRHWR